MTIQETIQKSIEGGYKPYPELWGDCPMEVKGSLIYVTVHPDKAWDSRGRKRQFKINEILMSPQFWKCLGKEMGWNMSEIQDVGGITYDGWAYYWHSFIDHLAENGSIDSFFDKL